jgi:hypothetical protein
MVHRPADARLLTNLLTSEKEYHKHLTLLLDHSHGSLTSLNAYAAASAPGLAQTIIVVAEKLASSDDALRKYAAAVEQWRERLVGLKAQEEDVAAIIRDREIL